ncbi:MAG: ribonuclease PH [Candidatus Omnitrophica bacterium]|nr:ribonuclease PH [Candidatus Omnitrophota bacterium]
MKRSDSRTNDQLRKINVVRNYLKHPEGSCLIELGNTRVICTATVESRVPLFLRNSGKGWVTAEYRMLPRATDNRVPRDRISGRNMEIQRLIGRSLRSVLDFEALGERTIWVDCDVISADGGTRIASVIGGFIALVDAVHKLSRQQLVFMTCIKKLLAAVSVGSLYGEKILDLNYEEDSNVDVDMNIVMTSSGEFIEVQGAAERGCFSRDDFNGFLDLAQKGINEIIEFERLLFKDILSGL